LESDSIVASDRPGNGFLTPFLLAVLLVAAFSACSPPLTVSQQVIAAIREMETRIENGERRPFMSHVAEDFNGQNGKLNRQELQRLVMYQLNRHQRLHAQLFPISVTETSEEAASAKFRALITGGPGWIPDQGQLYDFETLWRYQDGEWKLTSANWNPVRLD
jgi:hypothetical protein